MVTYLAYVPDDFLEGLMSTNTWSTVDLVYCCYSLSCSFRQISCQKIGCCPNSRVGVPPRLGNPGSATEMVTMPDWRWAGCEFKPHKSFYSNFCCLISWISWIFQFKIVKTHVAWQVRSKCDLELPNHLSGAISGHQSLYSGTNFFFQIADPGFPVGRLLSRYGVVKVPLMLRTALRMGILPFLPPTNEGAR